MSALPFRLLLLTDEHAARQAGRGVLETVARAMPKRAGEVAVLLRAKASPSAVLLEQARALRQITRARGALLLVHGDLEVARRAGADGVHLADGVLAPREPGELLVGASRHEGAPLDAADTAGLAYVALAPVFAPRSKPDDERAPLGLEGLLAHTRRSRVPVVALGGMTAERAAACLRAGVEGIAVLGAVMAAARPELAVAKLLEALSPRGR